ncbi:MAG: hypothetical protein K2X66_10690, partial [Cyanobacteria bacterium]|nr:hypothetical protein [Cyanobacteriota bacterium]
NVGLKPLLESEAIETRIQAGLALLENDYKFTRKEASLIQNDLIKLWDEYIEGDKQVGETKIGKNLFELTQRLTTQKSTPIFNKLSQVIFDYATPDADKGQIFGLMSQWLKQEPFNLDVAPLTINPWKEGEVLEEPTSSAKKAPKAAPEEIPVFDYATAFQKVENKLLDTKNPKLFATVLGHVLDLAEFTARPKKQDGTTSASTAPASLVGSNATPEFVDPKKLRGELAHLKAHLPKIKTTLEALEQGTLPSDGSAGDDISQALDNAALTSRLQKLIQILK